MNYTIVVSLKTGAADHFAMDFSPMNESKDIAGKSLVDTKCCLSKTVLNPKIILNPKIVLNPNPWYNRKSTCFIYLYISWFYGMTTIVRLFYDKIAWTITVYNYIWYKNIFSESL